MFPAHAGMNRDYELGAITLENVPRTRGDEPKPYGAGTDFMGCSPHTRG